MQAKIVSLKNENPSWIPEKITDPRIIAILEGLDKKYSHMLGQNKHIKITCVESKLPLSKNDKSYEEIGNSNVLWNRYTCELIIVISESPKRILNGLKVVLQELKQAPIRLDKALRFWAEFSSQKHQLFERCLPARFKSDQANEEANTLNTSGWEGIHYSSNNSEQLLQFAQKGTLASLWTAAGKVSRMKEELKIALLYELIDQGYAEFAAKLVEIMWDMEIQAIPPRSTSESNYHKVVDEFNEWDVQHLAAILPFMDSKISGPFVWAFELFQTKKSTNIITEMLDNGREKELALIILEAPNETRIPRMTDIILGVEEAPRNKLIAEIIKHFPIDDQNQKIMIEPRDKDRFIYNLLGTEDESGQLFSFEIISRERTQTLIDEFVQKTGLSVEAETTEKQTDQSSLTQEIAAFKARRKNILPYDFDVNKFFNNFYSGAKMSLKNQSEILKIASAKLEELGFPQTIEQHPKPNYYANVLARLENDRSPSSVLSSLIIIEALKPAKISVAEVFERMIDDGNASMVGSIVNDWISVTNLKESDSSRLELARMLAPLSEEHLATIIHYLDTKAACKLILYSDLWVQNGCYKSGPNPAQIFAAMVRNGDVKMVAEMVQDARPSLDHYISWLKDEPEFSALFSEILTQLIDMELEPNINFGRVLPRRIDRFVQTVLGNEDDQWNVKFPSDENFNPKRTDELIDQFFAGNSVP